ncbi:MAG: hypothetical protein ACK558_00700 [Pseudomonadota bacterium]
MSDKPLDLHRATGDEVKTTTRCMCACRCGRAGLSRGTASRRRAPGHGWPGRTGRAMDGRNAP